MTFITLLLFLLLHSDLLPRLLLLFFLPLQTGALQSNSSQLGALRNCLGSCAVEKPGQGPAASKPDWSFLSLPSTERGGTEEKEGEETQIQMDKQTRGSQNWSRCGDSVRWTDRRDGRGTQEPLESPLHLLLLLLRSSTCWYLTNYGGGTSSRDEKKNNSRKTTKKWCWGDIMDY